MKNIPLFKVFMSDESIRRSAEVLSSGYIGEGAQVKQFENDLKQYFKTNYEDIITCNSATSAEHLIYHMLKSDQILEIKVENTLITDYWPAAKGSTVLTTPLTCTATNWPILLNDYKIKWVDVNPGNMNIDLDDLQSKIDENTRIIQIVHWGGYPVDMDRLNLIVKNAERKYFQKILVIEDCAHAFGARYKSQMVGFTGNISTFSTQSIKHITTIDGGFLTSPYHTFNKKARLLRWYGIDRDAGRTDFRCEGDIPDLGFKFHMNDVSAAVGIGNLRCAKFIIESHKFNSNFYDSELEGVDGVTLLNRDPWAEEAAWLYTMKVERRDDFMKHMESCGISVSRVHERNDKHSSLVQYKTDLPMLESFIDNMICIPVGWWLNTEEVDYIVECIKKGW